MIVRRLKMDVKIWCSLCGTSEIRYESVYKSMIFEESLEIEEVSLVIWRDKKLDIALEKIREMGDVKCGELSSSLCLFDIDVKNIEAEEEVIE